RVVVAAAGINSDLWRRHLNLAEAVGEGAIQRHAGDLRRGIPKRHIERPHRDATLPVTARFLAGHHHPPCAERVEGSSGLVTAALLARPDDRSEAKLSAAAALVCQSVAQRLLPGRNRKSADSALEGGGFELPVPGLGRTFLYRPGVTAPFRRARGT